MNLNDYLVQREQELLQEIENLEKVELSLKERKDELQRVRGCLSSVPSSNPLEVRTNKEVDVSDLLLAREEFDRKFHKH